MNDYITILDGGTFVVSDRNGDIHPSKTLPSGLFSSDTRFLSTWALTINDDPLTPLSVDDIQYFEARFFLVPGQPTQYVDATLSVIRDRSLAGSFVEALTIINHDVRPARLSVRLEIGSDFADIFEIKNVRQKAGQIRANVENDRLRLSYQRDTFRRDTVVSSSSPGQFDERGLSFYIELPPSGQWDTTLHVETSINPAQRMRFGVNLDEYRTQIGVRKREQLDEWLAKAPRLVCERSSLIETYQRSLTDIAALRYTLLGVQEHIPAAGVPWFMAPFGRDSLITGLQMLPFTPELAYGALRVMAIMQGARLDDFRDLEPGKMLHEIRYGESAAFEEQPHAVYYGSVDSTPLFLVLLDEYERWTGDGDLVREFESESRAALNWIDTYADIMGNGYLWYMTRNEQTGLENQCWKDSWNSISYRDGRIPDPPRATCEAQGYAYDARMRAARMARQFWNDAALAEQLERQAADLKVRFNRDFWVEDGEYYALALDYDAGQVDALSSNVGHLLWSGIVDQDRAQKVVRHLMGPRLFSGWGVRTLAEGEGRYNPIGYHLGTVWLFDNSIIAWGLKKYGFDEEAGQIAAAIFDAANYFRGRLPEAFAGYHRTQTKYPVEYPTACSPQAWSAGAPFLLLRAVLGLDPVGERLTWNPTLPDGFGRVELLDIPGRWGRVDVLGGR